MSNHPAPWKHVSHYVARSIAETELRTDYPEIGHLSTGVSELDDYLGPLLDGGKLVTLAASSGAGKTTLFYQLATAFSGQTKCLLFSLEDDPTDGVRRPMAAMSDQSVRSLRSGYTEGTLPSELYDASETLNQLPLDVVEEAGDILDIGRTIAQWVKATGDSADGVGILPRVVLIDQLSHIQLAPLTAQMFATLSAAGIPCPKPEAREHDLLEWMCAVLRYIARKYNILIILAVQLNDNRGDDGKPTQASIRSSRGIVHKSDSVLALWRPKEVANPAHDFDAKAPKTIPNEYGRTWILDLKSRLTAGGELELTWDGPQQRFSNLNGAKAKMTIPPPMGGRALEGYTALAALRASWNPAPALEAGTAPAIEGPTGSLFDEVIDAEVIDYV